MPEISSTHLTRQPAGTANELSVFQYNDVNVIDSRQVAEMIGKEHKNLLRDIAGYVKIIEASSELKFEPTDQPD